MQTTVGKAPTADPFVTARWAGIEAMKKGKKDSARARCHDPYEKAFEALSVSYMNDTKWRKALGAIADAGLRLERATWKFIDSECLHEWGVPRRSDLLPTRLADGRFQPVEYKWIEYIRFPREWRPASDECDTIEHLRRVLAGVGRFQIAEDEQGLTLFGYGR